MKDNPVCEGLVEFRAEIEEKGVDADTIKWYINGEEELSARDEILWEKPFSVGNYEIKMWVHFENNDTISKTGTLTIETCTQSAAFYMNDVHYETDTTFCNKTVHFRAETSALSTEPEHIRWYIDYNDGNGYVEEPAALDQTQWNKNFVNGTYPVKMWVRFANDEEATITSTLKIKALSIKIRNMRY